MSFWDANGPLGLEPFMPASMEENVRIARLGVHGKHEKEEWVSGGEVIFDALQGIVCEFSLFLAI